MFRPGSDPIGNLTRALMETDVFGSGDEKNRAMQMALGETTLRRSSLGLVEVIHQARVTSDSHGEPLLHHYENLLVVVDQFEELFRFKQLIDGGNSSEDAAAFVKLLLEAVRQKDEKIYVVLTMRSDFLGDSAQFWDLPETINSGQYLIPRMTRDERREAIAGPVAVGQGTITEPLVNQLLNDVGDNPDQLPILQHALMRTWDYWASHRLNGEPIDLSHYTAIGGMAGALSLHADEAYLELSDGGKKIAEKMFKGLTEKGTDSREVRRPMELREICRTVQVSVDDVVPVIDSFRRKGRSFLMPPVEIPLTEESLIDISHESLIRNWQRLKVWVDEEARSARIYRRLAETATLYQKSEAGLWRDPDLQLALNWREETRPNEAWAARYHPDFAGAMKFLDESREARDREAIEREQRLKKERRRNYLFIIVLAGAFLVSSAFAVYAAQQQRKALWQEGQTKIALQKQRETNVLLETALTSANEATERAQKAETVALDEKKEKELAFVKEKEAKQRTEEALKRAQLASVSEKRAKIVALQEERKAVESAMTAMENEKLAQAAKKEAEDAGGRAKDAIETIQYIDSSVPYSKAVLRGSRETVSNALFSPDGSQVAAFSADRRGRIWTANSKDKGINQDEAINPVVLQGNTGAIVSAAFTPDGQRLIAVSRDNVILVWDARTGECLNQGGKCLGDTTLPGQTVLSNTMNVNVSPVASAAISPDGKFVVTNSISDILPFTVTDTATRKSIALRGHSKNVNNAAFSPVSKYVVTCGDDATARVWRADTGEAVKVLNNPSGEVKSVRFSPDGRLIITFSGNSARIWDWEKGVSIAELKGHDNPITGIAFSRGGELMATSSNKEKTVQVWRLATGKRAVSFKNQDALVTNVAISPDSTMVVTTNADRTARLWDIATGKLLRVLSGHSSPATSVEFSRDGQYILTAGDRTARVWDGSRGYDFTNRATEAKWVSGREQGQSAELKFPGKEDDSRGFALLRENYYMEDGSIPSGKVLEAHPLWEAKGFISGVYPEYTVTSGDHFKADLGFIKGGAAGEVTVQLRYIKAGENLNLKSWGNDVLALPMLGSWTKKYNGSLMQLETDLSSVEGEKVQFVIVVLANESSAQDWATLVNPRIEK
jgi:WD40 repeat protein